MSSNKAKGSIKIFAAVSFVAMIVVNALANTIPINGQGTGQVSDSYPNLFAPTGFTFAIWGLIYLLLAGYTIYQLGFFQKKKDNCKVNLPEKIGLYFALSSIANALWIISWHYHKISLSLLLMIVILICLIKINGIINRENLSAKEELLIRLPFSVYFGWITVAAIANATTLLVSLGWNGFGIPEATWAVVIISVGAIIGITTMLKNRDFAYGLVFLWAYAGILIKHTAATGFSGQYPAVIITVNICIVLFAIAEAYILFSNNKK